MKTSIAGNSRWETSILMLGKKVFNRMVVSRKCRVVSIRHLLVEKSTRNNMFDAGCSSDIVLEEPEMCCRGSIWRGQVTN